MTAEPEVYDQAAPTDPMPRALTRVRHVSRAGLYTAPMQAAAARLLVDMEATGARHGITPDAWSLAADLPGACVDVMADHYRGEDQVQAELVRQGYQTAAALAVHLVDLLHERLAGELGVTSTHRPGTYSVTFSVARGRFRRGVRAGSDGWHYDTDGPGPVSFIYAPFTPEGAAAVADVVAEIVAGTRPDPLLPPGFKR